MVEMADTTPDREAGFQEACAKLRIENNILYSVWSYGLTRELSGRHILRVQATMEKSRRTIARSERVPRGWKGACRGPAENHS